MTVNTLSTLTLRSLTPSFQDSSTPGSIFLSQMPSFRQTGKDVYHYTFDSVDSSRKKRSTTNVVFSTNKNNVDPYVHASNWLPKFKDLCRGYLARQKAKDLRRKHEAAQTIQRAWETNMDPWMQIFEAIRPTFKVVKMDEMKKYLRQCIIQIKKLNDERQYIESLLGDVEDIMEKSYQLTDNIIPNVSVPRSPILFAKSYVIQKNVNNDTFFRECMDIDIKGVTDVEVFFDPSSRQGSKVNVVYELADKIQQKMCDDKHKEKSLLEKCQLLEKEIDDLRTANSSMDTTTKTLRGVVNKHDINLQEQKEKAQDYFNLLEKMNQEKKIFLSKIKELENKSATKDEELVEANQKCEYLEAEFDRKTGLIETLNQEKLRQETKVKELEYKLNYNLENQCELESTIAIQKTKLTEMKKRLSMELKTTEDELMEIINDNKQQLMEQNEIIENQSEQIKENEMTIRKLEFEIEKVKNAEGSDNENEKTDYDNERRLGQNLKNANSIIDALREEVKVLESNNEELKHRVYELQTNVEKANDDTTEHKKMIERLKTQIESSKSAINETELKLNRANRDRNFNHQKWTQAKVKMEELELELTKVREELTCSNQVLNGKNREMESLESELSCAKKGYESKIAIYEKSISELQTKLDQSEATLSHKSEEWKKEQRTHDHEKEKLQQTLEKKEIEIEQHKQDKTDNQKSLKKLQRRIEEQEEIQADSQKIIIKLKDQIQTLQNENESQMNSLSNSSLTSPLNQRIFDLQTRERNISRSHSNRQAPQTNRSDTYLTLPTKRSEKE